MATINFIQPLFVDNNKKYVYADLHLDMAQEQIYDKSGATTDKTKSDIKIDYNIDAIKNSLYNIFNVRRGQRPLYPEVSTNLEQFLFEPINENTSRNIGKELQRAISTFEPRVIVSNIHVTIPKTYDRYVIDVSLYIPALSINTVINVGFDYNGFVIR